MPDDTQTVEPIFTWENSTDDEFHKEEFMLVELGEEDRPGMLRFSVGGFCGEPGGHVHLPMADVARLAQALVRLPMVQELKGYPLVLWFPTKEDADELAGAIKDAMPNLRPVEIG